MMIYHNLKHVDYSAKRRFNWRQALGHSLALSAWVLIIWMVMK